MARDWILAGHIICRGRPLNSFTVKRAARRIGSDQTERTLFARTKQTSFIVISSFFGLRDFVYFQNVMLFSEKCADPDEKSYYACDDSSCPSLLAKVPLKN